MLSPPSSFAARCAALKLRSRIATAAFSREYASAHSRPMPSAPPVNTMTLPSRSPGFGNAILPVVVRSPGKALHGFFHVLLCNRTFTFVDQIDNSLVCLQILVPCRSCLAASCDPHAHEGK